MLLSKISVFLLILLYSIPSYSQTKLPSFFSSQMVLQQNQEVKIWGSDNPETSVTVIGSWGNEAKAEAGKNGKWNLRLKTPLAGGPYTLTINGSNEIILNDILIGEVWLCSGQSNMEMPLKGYRHQPIIGSNEEIISARKFPIRQFKTERNTSLEPLDDLEGRWLNSDANQVKEFSATAFFFAKKLHSMLNVPIGLIHTSWSGSAAEAWTDKETVIKFNRLAIPNEIPKKGMNQEPTVLYNAMLYPFTGYDIKGFIWYQGENNCRWPIEYRKLFPAMIELWRDKWRQPDLPFYFVQIAPYGYKDNNSPFLRESQLITMQTVKNTGMAVTMDIGNCRSIHPADKKTVGDRLAYWALAKTYNFDGIAYSGPIYKEMKITDDGKIIITFDYVPVGVSSFGKEKTGFTIAGKNKVFYPAVIKYNRDRTVTVWSEKVKNPVAVRYAFEACIEGKLFNTAGLPASSFRTDDWDE